MVRSALGKVAWVGRTASMVFGLALVMALVIGVASMALAGTGVGAAFNLGKINAVNAMSTLQGSANSSMLKIDNNSTGDAAAALTLLTEAGKPPMKVNAQAKVGNLNSDKLDGLDSSQFLGKTEKAADADKVDGRHATDLIRVASAKSVNDARVGTDGVVLTTSISAPTAGFLVIDASSDVYRFSSTTGFPTCFIRVDGTFDIASERAMELNVDPNSEENCATNTVIPVTAGEHTVNLEAEFMTSGTVFDESTLSALFVPFDGSGEGPATAAIASAEEAKEAPEEGSQPNR